MQAFADALAPEGEKPPRATLASRKLGEGGDLSTLVQYTIQEPANLLNPRHL